MTQTCTSPLTSVCLSVGEDRASTRSLGQTLSIRSCSTWDTNERTSVCEGGLDSFLSSSSSGQGSTLPWCFRLFDFSIPYLSFLVADPPVELLAVDAEEIFSWVDDAALDGDGPSRVNVVACDHSHCYSGTLTFLDGVGHLNRDTKG